MNSKGNRLPVASLWRWLHVHAADSAGGIVLAVVVGSTGFISYTHICALTMDLYQSWKTGHLMPLAIDGQLVIGSFIWTRVPGRLRWCGLAGIIPGLAESGFANWESGAPHGYVAASWSLVVAEAFAVSCFLFELWLKQRKAARGHAAEAGQLTTEQLLGLLVASASERAVAAVLEVERGQVQKWKRGLAAAAAEEVASAA